MFWVPTDNTDTRAPETIPEAERDYYLERRYPSFGNLVPRDVASRAAKAVCDQGRGVGETQRAVYLDFADAIKRLGRDAISERYGNLFEMYERITGENPYEVPMRIYPAVHYTMGGLWVDYELQSTIPGLFVLGEANFSDHGANRLGASALMQGLADGYFVIPYTLGSYLADIDAGSVDGTEPAFQSAQAAAVEKTNELLNIKGSRTVTEFHRELGRLVWDDVGMARNEEGLKSSIKSIQSLKEEFWQDVNVPGTSDVMNKNLEFAGRVGDFFELAELMARDALERKESCGGHFRDEYKTEEGEALRNDNDYAYVAAWENNGPPSEAILHKEEIPFENVKPSTRSYK